VIFFLKKNYDYICDRYLDSCEIKECVKKSDVWLFKKNGNNKRSSRLISVEINWNPRNKLLKIIYYQ